MSNADYLLKTISKYIGYKVDNFAKDDEGTFGIILKAPRGKKKVVLWVLQDAEGNGPGFIQVQEL